MNGDTSIPCNLSNCDCDKPKAPHALTREQVDKWIEHLRIVVPQRFHANPDGSLGPNTMTALDALSWREWEFIAWLFNDYAAQRQALIQQAQELENLKATQGYNAKFSQVLAEQAQEVERLQRSYDADMKHWTEQLATLQATLAERVAEVGELNVQLRDARQDAARLRAALELCWTKEMPTKPGLYFYRRDSLVDTCRVAQFDIDENTFRHSKPCEWAGPIPLPIEQAQRALKGA